MRTGDGLRHSTPTSVGARRQLLRVAGLSKTFADAKVLDDVSLEVAAGEVLAVVGQNGSGKSTLVKLLAGIHQPDPGGVIEVCDATGELVPRERAASLHFIHQDLGLLPALNTTENLDLSRPLGPRWMTPVRRWDEHARAAELTERFGAHIDVRAPVATLSPAERAIVAIVRALDGWEHRNNVLVLDEPTTAFHHDEVARLFDAVRRVASEGAGIIFISHRLDEVRAIADRVLVLRDGKPVKESDAHLLDDAMLVEAIVGEASTSARRTAESRASVALEITELRAPHLDRLSFTAHAGEIVGVSGVLGSGREHLNAVLFGAEPRIGGRVELAGADLPAGDIAACMDAGVAFVPGDRHRLGAVMSMSARENLTLPTVSSFRRRTGALRLGHERAEAAEWVDRVGLRPAQPDRPLSTFSGGNQQKIVLAKWLRTDPRLLLLDEPTQGVDVGAKAAIYRLIQQAAEHGSAVVVSSSDSKELASICHRVLLMEQGRIAGELAGPDLTEEALVHASLAASSSAGADSVDPQEVSA